MGDRTRDEQPDDPLAALTAAFSELGPVMADGVRRYVLIDRLSSDDDDAAWLAEDRRHTDADKTAFVTIRVFGVRGESERRRVGDAARRAFHVRDAGLIRVLDTGVDEQLGVYVVEEYAGARTLRTELDSRGGPMPEREAAEAAASLAEALQAAHGAGLVRCAPAAETVRIDDSGALRAPCVAWQSVSRPGGLRLADEGAVQTTADDVRDVASIAAELMGCQDPSSVSDRTLREVLLRAHEGGYASADALARDLRRWLEHWPIEWLRPGAWRQTTLLARRSPVHAAVMAVTLVAMVVAVGSLAWGRQRELARLELEAQREAVRRTLEQQLPSIEGSIDDATSMLAVHWVIEWLSGPSLLDEPNIAALAIDRRIEALEVVIAQERARNGESLTALLWESGRLFWLAVQGDWRRGEALADAHTQAWAELRDGDPWLETLGLIRSCFVVSRAVEGEVDQQELASALGALKGAKDVSMGKPLERLIEDRIRQGKDALLAQGSARLPRE